MIYAPYVLNTAVSFEYVVPAPEEFQTRIIHISSKYPYIKAVDNGEISTLQAKCSSGNGLSWSELGKGIDAS